MLKWLMILIFFLNDEIEVIFCLCMVEICLLYWRVGYIEVKFVIFWSILRVLKVLVFWLNDMFEGMFCLGME